MFVLLDIIVRVCWQMLRNERFSAEFLARLEELLDALAPCVILRFRESPAEAQELNRSIAQFLKVRKYVKAILENEHGCSKRQ